MICGSQTPSTKELQKLDSDYPVNDHARAMCQVGQTFTELIENDVPTDDDHVLLDSDVDIDSDTQDSKAGYLSPNIEEDDYQAKEAFSLFFFYFVCTQDNALINGGVA